MAVVAAGVAEAPQRPFVVVAVGASQAGMLNGPAGCLIWTPRYRGPSERVVLPVRQLLVTRQMAVMLRPAAIHRSAPCGLAALFLLLVVVTTVVVEPIRQAPLAGQIILRRSLVSA